MNNIKIVSFIIFSLILLFIWNMLFILQAGIGYNGNILLLPIKFLPIFLYTFFALWLILKMFDDKNKISKTKHISCAVAGFAVLLSFSFQHFIVSKKMAPFTFKNKLFSHIKTIRVNDKFSQRLILSTAEYSKLIPLGSLTSDTASYFANITAEAAVVLELKNLLSKKTIDDTCKQYLDNGGGYGSCVVDFQKDIYSTYLFSSTGNVLLVASGALGVFQIRHIMSEKYGKKNLYVLLKASNDLMGSSFLAVEKVKLASRNSDHVTKFSMGYEIRPGTLLFLIEQQINYKFLATVFKRMNKLIISSEKKISQYENTNSERSISSQTEQALVQGEKEHLQKLKVQFLSLQENGYNVDEIKLKQEKLNQDLNIKIQQLKRESLMFKILAFFRPSLNDLSIDDFVQAEEDNEDKYKENDSENHG